MKHRKIAALPLKLRVNAETVLHLRPVREADLQNARGGGMTTYHPICETGTCDLMSTVAL